MPFLRTAPHRKEQYSASFRTSFSPLLQPTTGVREVLEKFTDQEFTVEYKYDGERAQVHVLDGGKTVHIFSRWARCRPRVPLPW